LTNLSKVFGQFAELQQQIATQVAELEASFRGQREEFSSALDQMPEIRDRINWLIANLYDQANKEEAVSERLAAQEIAVASLERTVRGLVETTSRWNATMDEVIDALVRARSATNPSRTASDPK